MSANVEDLEELRAAAQRGEALARAVMTDQTYHDKLAAVIALLQDDAYAMTFQSMGQYRAALIRALKEKP